MYVLLRSIVWKSINTLRRSSVYITTSTNLPSTPIRSAPSGNRRPAAAASRKRQIVLGGVRQPVLRLVWLVPESRLVREPY